MNKETIKEKYLKIIEPRIESAQQYADNPYFDKLYAICNSSYGYRLFYPICDGFHSKKVDFDAFCQLFGDISYCCEDDGEMTFISPIIEVESDRSFREFKFPTYEDKECFIMLGERDNLDPIKVKEIATKHFSYKKTKLKSYVATRFDWGTIDFLYGLLGEWEIIAKMGDGSAGIEESLNYFKEGKKMDEKMAKWIKESKYSYEWQNNL